MKRFAVASGGVVVNVVQAEDSSEVGEPGKDVFEDAAGSVNVGDAYTPNPVDAFGDEALKVILSLQNEIREMKELPALKDVAELKAELRKTVRADVAAVEAGAAENP